MKPGDPRVRRRTARGRRRGALEGRRASGVPQTGPNTIADGLLTSTGELTWPIIRDQVERIFTVTDDQIRAAMRLVWERMKLVVEPSGAVGAAVVLTDEFQALGGRRQGRRRLQRREREPRQAVLVDQFG